MNPFWGMYQPLHGITLSQASILEAIAPVFARGSSPSVLACSPATYAAIRATIDFQGRDRRRIKREVNKAMRKARRK